LSNPSRRIKKRISIEIVGKSLLIALIEVG
jgi:hypothetical protein